MVENVGTCGPPLIQGGYFGELGPLGLLPCDQGGRFGPGTLENKMDVYWRPWVAQPAEQQKRLVGPLQGWAPRLLRYTGTKGWEPGPGLKTCFSCGHRGHRRGECRYWVREGRPHPDKMDNGRAPLPSESNRGVTKVLGLWGTWAPEEGVRWGTCRALASPRGRAKPQKAWRRVRTQGRHKWCFHCHAAGHIKRHCPQGVGQMGQHKAQEGVVEIRDSRKGKAEGWRLSTKWGTHLREGRASVGTQAPARVERTTVGIQTLEEGSRLLLRVESLQEERDTLRAQLRRTLGC